MLRKFRFCLTFLLFRQGLVTDALKDIIAREPVAQVVAVGPLPMKRAVADLTKPHGIFTLVSLNAIMVDGTGMCGGCRVSVGGETKFACFDGPDFDGADRSWTSARHAAERAGTTP